MSKLARADYAGLNARLTVMHEQLLADYQLVAKAPPSGGKTLANRWLKKAFEAIGAARFQLDECAEQDGLITHRPGMWEE
jgi:hypothetical protein